MDIINEKIAEAVHSIELTTEKFYQNKTQEGFIQLEKTLTTLINTINELYAYRQQGNEIGIEERQLEEVLTEAMKAMENKDTLLLSDILQYELKELLEKVQSTLM